MAILLFLTGLLLHDPVAIELGNQASRKGQYTDMNWVKELFDLQHSGKGAVLFLMACIQFIGSMTWLYTVRYES